MIVLILLSSFITLLFYIYLKINFSYWKRKGVDSPKANFLFGSVAEAVTLKKSLGQVFEDIYRNFEGYAYVGCYKIHRPAILLRDPELIKTVLMGDFQSFHDNDVEVDEKFDPLFGKNPFVLNGNRWKVIRTQLSSCFTSGKIKTVVPLTNETCNKLTSYVDKEIERNNGKCCFHIKELSSMFTTENVALCAFGLNAGCFDNPNAELREIGRDILNPSFWLGIQHMFIFMAPYLATKLRMKFFSENVTKKFSKIILETLKYRRENNIRREDFLDMLIDMKSKESEYPFDDEDILSHAVGFYGDGFETSAITLTFLLYELATNLDVQKKLRDEVDEMMEKHGKDITYDVIQSMKYLDMVFWESMRKNPSVYFLPRVCTKTFKFPSCKLGADGPEVTIESGTPVWISISGIQSDEKFFPNPEKFMPERFLEENKNKVKKGTFMPFGEGPRMCLGQRFGVLQVKMAVVALISKFALTLNNKTLIPLKLDPLYFMRSAIGGIWIDFRKRESN